MTWSALRSTNGIYEHNGTYSDSGNLPFIWNRDVNNIKPLYDNDSLPIDEATLPNGSYIKYWLDDTPTNSQADTSVGATWNNTGNNMYVLEFSRKLNTTNSDDIVLDFINDELYFLVGVEDNNDVLSLNGTFLDSYLLCGTNEAPSLTFDIIDPLNPTQAIVEEALLITGTVYDDFLGWELIVYLSGSYKSV